MNAPRPSRRLHPHRPARAGFTLLELLVVSMLTILLTMIIAQAWRHLSAGMNDAAARTRCAQELRLAVSSLSRDLALAVAATPVEGGRILFCLDGGSEPDGQANWGEPDQTVEYLLRGRQLVRRLSPEGTEFIVADDLAEFSIQTVAESIQLTLRTQRHKIWREISLTWSPP